MSTDLTTQDDSALTDMQHAFVDAYATGTLTAEQAAITAGYSPPSARTLGPRLLKQEKILRAVHAATLTNLASTAPMAIRAQQELLASARSEFVRAQVADSILDRCFGKAVNRVDTTVSGELTVTIDLS